MIKLNANQITNKLIELNCKEWKKGEHHRIYLDGCDAERLFDCFHAKFGKSHSVYFDVKNGEFRCSNKNIKNNLNSMMA